MQYGNKNFTILSHFQAPENVKSLKLPGALLLSRVCSSKIRCYTCKLRHHVSICDPKGQVPHAEPCNPPQVHQSTGKLGANLSQGVDFLQSEVQIC